MTVESRAADLAGLGRSQAHRAADSTWMHALARGGLCARGIVYVLVSALAAQIALGREGKSADQKGALQEVSEQAFGRAALVVLAAGFAGYAAWRLSTAITGDPGTRGDTGAKQAAQRLAAGVQGAIYAALCLGTVAILAGSSAASSTSQKPAAPTSRLLALPAGRLLVVAIGVGVLLTGVGLAWWALRQKFEERLMMGRMRPETRLAVTGLGTAGHVSRAVVFVLVGVSLVKVAADYDAAKAQGLDDALRSLAADPYGTAMLLITALGFLAFGVFSFLEARYRQL